MNLLLLIVGTVFALISITTGQAYELWNPETFREFLASIIMFIVGWSGVIMFFFAVCEDNEPAPEKQEEKK